MKVMNKIAPMIRTMMIALTISMVQYSVHNLDYAIKKRGKNDGFGYVSFLFSTSEPTFSKIQHFRTTAIEVNSLRYHALCLDNKLKSKTKPIRYTKDAFNDFDLLCSLGWLTLRSSFSPALHTDAPFQWLFRT